jgi:hypothetical protein
MRTRYCKLLLLNLLVLVGLLLAGCGPEANRVRGGGPGGDARNLPRDGIIRMHGERDPAYQTPFEGRAIVESRQAESQQQ